MIAVKYINKIDEEEEKQFSAITVLMPDDTIYVSYRGTDNTIVGWKEDFNMSFKSHVASQLDSVKYLEEIAKEYPNIKLRVGGHSKGGNLAQYAALCTDEGTYRRIIAIYDHDGPSFLEDPSPRRTTAEYDRKLHKLVPESSAFGMILERRDDYRVVQSSASAIFQHHPFSWMVEGDDFVYQ